jgi:hypothetical protein
LTSRVASGRSCPQIRAAADRDLDQMAYRELRHLTQLRDRWIAIDPRGGKGIVALRSGAVVVDCDDELDALCRRLADANKTSLTILYCGERLRA